MSTPLKAKTLPCGRAAPLFPVAEERKFEKWQEQLKTYLSSQGLKYSEQRWKIARSILERRGHFSAQEIVREVTKDHPGLGAATVYRNLKVLCEAHILRETLVDAEGRVVYEAYGDQHHDHIVCLDCGEIFEFCEPKIEKLQDEISEELSFRPVRHRHILYARCELRKTKK